MMQVTQWFSYTEPPVHIGVYEVKSFERSDEPSGFARWDGKNWSYIGFFKSMNSRKKCFEYANNTSDTHAHGFIESWRGIAVNDNRNTKVAEKCHVALPVTITNEVGDVILDQKFTVATGDTLNIVLKPVKHGAAK